MPSVPPSLDKGPTALDSTVDALEAMILDEASPGESLPAEADLAERLGVSRLTVREALKVLSGRGLVDLGRGRKPVVRDRDSAVLAGYLANALRRDPRGLLELNAIRQALETLSASLAAREASRAGLAALEAALDDMHTAAESVDAEGGRSSLEAYHRADIAFHEALALASGNRMLAFMLESLEECLRDSFDHSARGHFARGGTSADVVSAHRAIFEAVRARKPAAASAAMTAHLRESARDLQADPRAVSPSTSTRGRESTDEVLADDEKDTQG